MSVYELLYHVTFVLHATCASFVFGASMWVVGDAARSVVAGRRTAPIADALRDLQPFVLGLAITFGIGPLLFIQILDGHAFYTAVILLSHRFMAILPALILGFYLLYVQKTSWRVATAASGRLAIGLIALGCFAYTAWHWSEQHLLAQRPSVWPEAYVEGPARSHVRGVPLRLLVFVGAASLTTSTLAASRLGATPPLRRLAFGGLAITVAGLLLLANVPSESPPLGSLAEQALPPAIALLLAGVAWAVERLPNAARFAATLLVIERIAALRWDWKQSRSPEPLELVASDQGFALFVGCLIFTLAAIAVLVQRVRADLR